MSEELYALLKQRDEEIAQLRRTVQTLIAELVGMYAADEQDKAYDRASAIFRDVYNQLGLKSDGRMRGCPRCAEWVSR